MKRDSIPTYNLRYQPMLSAAWASVAAFALAVCLSGCTKDAANDDTPAIAPDGSFRTRIELSLPQGNAVVTPTEKPAPTRTAQDDKEVTDLWILQFSVNTPAGALVRAEYVKNIGTAGGKLRTEATLTAGEKMQLVLVANSHDPNLYAAATLPAGATLAQFEAITIPITATRGTSLPADDSEGLPMSGRTDAAGIKLPVAGNIVTLTMHYAVAKLALTLDLTKLPEGTTFTPRSATLLHVPTTIGLGTIAADAVTPAAEAASFTDYEAIPIANGTPSQFTWYMATNQRGKGTATSPRKKTDATAPAGQADYCTYIEVTGEYRDNPEAGTSEVTYRLWPGENNTDDYNITAGTYYELAIVPLGASLADSRVKAYTDFGFGMADPDGEHDGETTWGPTNLSKNGTANCYIVSEAGMKYKFNARVKGNGKATLTVNDPNVYAGSDPSLNQRARITPDDDLIAPKPLAPASVFVIWSTGSDINGLIEDVKIGNGYVYFTTTGIKGEALAQGNAVIGVKDADDNLIWSWHIWATDYNSVTDDEDYITRELADDGLTTPWHTVATPSRTFKMMGRHLGATNNTPGDVGSLGLLYQWGRKDPFIGAKATYFASAETTPFQEQTAETQTASGYQWQAKAKSPAGAGADASIAYTVKNPTHFLCSDNTIPYDWLNVNTIAEQRDYLWGNPNPTNTLPNPSAGSKSIYDPCPPGYRVPPQDSWTRFTLTGMKADTPAKADWNVTSTTWTNTGWIYYYTGDKIGATTFYPAPGMRNDKNGLIGGIGSTSNTWSSSPMYGGSYQPGAFGANPNSIIPCAGTRRAFGMPVRCAKE